MSPQHWQEVEEIFQASIDLAPEERALYVAEKCAGKAELQREVEALLAQYEEAGDFLTEPLSAQGRLGALAAFVSEEDDGMTGKLVGAYRIEREIGRGGMGTVYLAERADKAFQRRVAIKVIKRGMDTDFILRRFRRERQILAALDHPNIARLLDAGATESGLPYFVMEYIEGKPLYRHCDAGRLNIQDRLKLFCEVCRAVEYAHEKQIIHRDIKPSNILISTGGAAKLFDFGIAKLLDPELNSDTTPLTATSMRMMTVEYASPEQVQGLPVTFLSDVYSLGVVLYELLTGHRPYAFRNRLLHEMARIICEETPEYPSIAVGQPNNLLPSVQPERDALTVGDVCEARGAALEILRRELSGDLDNIMLKALRKEPAERYQSVAEFRDDIVRHLEGSPVSAPVYFPSAIAPRVPPVRSSIQAAASVAVLPLKVLSLREAGDTDENYLSVGLADALVTRLSNVRSLVVRPTSSILRYGGENSDPLAAGRELGVEFVLDGRIRVAGDRIRISLQLINVRGGASVWAHQFDEQFTEVLSVEDAISEQVAEVLVPRLTSEERRQLKKRGTDNPEAFEVYLRGRYYWNTFTEEGFARALGCYQQAIALDPSYALAYTGIADYYNWLGVYGVRPFGECSAAAKNMAEKAVELDETLGEAHAALGFAIVTHDFDWATAERHHRRAIELNPNYATAHQWYSFHLQMEGRFEEAIREMRRARELDPLTPSIMQSLGWCYYQARQFDESGATYRNLLDAAPNFAYGLITYAWMLRHVGQHDESVAAARQAVEYAGGGQFFLTGLAASYAAAGRRDETLELLGQLRELSAKRYVSPYHLALVHLWLGDRARALSLLEEAFAMREGWLVWLGVEPQFDLLRDEPRFIELLRLTSNPAAAWRVRLETEPGKKSIAVLPFRLVGKAEANDTSDEFLGIGLADALITRLSNLPRFIVRPTSSILRYRDPNSDPIEAGRQLAVDYVLDGSLRRVGVKLRAGAQLLNVSEGASRWAGRFDEEIADVLHLEDSIAEQVAGALIPHLTGEERRRLNKRGTDSPEAFEVYLRGRYYWNTSTEEGFARALLCYQQAIALDPSYALAYTGVADYYNWLGVFAVLPFRETSAAAKEAALTAVSLDDTLAEAHSALGFATLTHDFDWSKAEQQHRRALDLNPNCATVHLWYSYQLTQTGRFDEALAEVRRALELDPLSPLNYHTLTWCYYHSRRFDDSIATSRRLVQMEPHYGLGHLMLALVLRHAGAHDEAIQEGLKAVELLGRSPYTLSWLASIHIAAGRTEEARELVREIEEMAAVRYVSPYILAMVYCHLGDKERAFGLLEQALEIGDGWVLWLGVEPQLDPLRGDPRYRDMLRRTNNPISS